MRSQKSIQAKPASPQVITRVSRYDQWSAGLTSGVVLIGVMVILLFGIWLAMFSAANELVTLGPSPTTRDLSDLADHKMPVSFSFATPGYGELPEAKQFQMKKALLAVSQVPSRVLGAVESLTGDAAEQGQKGFGWSDERQPGPPQDEALPEWERWKLAYEVESKDEYFKILDGIGSYLGAVFQTSNKILFLNNLADEKSTVVAGNRTSPKAQVMYFRNLETKLRDWEKQRLVSGGLGSEDAVIVVQFVPAELAEKLLHAESEAFEEAGKTLSEVKKTTFKCCKTDSGYEFRVDKIEYRPKSD